jgi:hypothetical protein
MPTKRSRGPRHLRVAGRSDKPEARRAELERARSAIEDILAPFDGDIPDELAPYASARDRLRRRLPAREPKSGPELIKTTVKLPVDLWRRVKLKALEMDTKSAVLPAQMAPPAGASLQAIVTLALRRLLGFVEVLELPPLPASAQKRAPSPPVDALTRALTSLGKTIEHVASSVPMPPDADEATREAWVHFLAAAESHLASWRQQIAAKSGTS